MGEIKETLALKSEVTSTEAKSWAQNYTLSETANKWIRESSLPQSVKDQWLAGK
jgi:hypothetical protein